MVSVATNAGMLRDEVGSGWWLLLVVVVVLVVVGIGWLVWRAN